MSSPIETIDIKMEIDDTALNSPEASVSANETSLSLLPEKSRNTYEKTYAEFKSWWMEMEVTDYSEPVLLAYFSDIVRRDLIGSLWPKFSMLKSTLLLKDNVDISNYNQLIMFIKTQQEGYVPKKSKVLEKEQVHKFISDAPDCFFLMMKVVLIFGVSGALRKDELLKLQTDDVQDLGSKFLVTIKATKTKTNRIFTIVDNEQNTLLNLIRHYISLRPANTPHKRFFVFYKNNKCSTQPVGINSFSKLPSQIAAFLKLEQPHLYTGHCFRRSSASIFSGTGTLSPAIQRQGGWESTTVAEGHISESSITSSKQKELESTLDKLKIELSKSKERQDEYEKETKRREVLIQEQSEQIEKLNEVVERCASSVPDRQQLLEELHELRAQLKVKSENYDRLELSVKDMREALTAEVADKHDNVVALRRECQLLEERCRQADKQTHFKDDIIKEMRKELKQYRSNKCDVENKDSEKEEMRKQIMDLKEENDNLYKTISTANVELNVLHELITKYYDMFEESENKILVTAQQLKTFKSKPKFNTTNLLKLDSNSGLKIAESLTCLEKFCGELMLISQETKEQTETMCNLKNKISEHISPTDNMLVIKEEPIDYPEASAHDFSTTILLLKTDISKMILWKNDNEMGELKKHVSSIENALYDVRSKEKLMKTKDEMICVQNDTLNIAQKELQELREKLAEVEREREKRAQEVLHLQETLKMNQNTIEELQKTLKNTEEKAQNIQQTVDVYVETITLLENAKNKSEIEVEQQRITIGNLQEALVSVKKQLAEMQSHNGAELKEKCAAIYNLYQEYDEMQAQYMTCYGENIKLSQTADCLRDANLELKVVNLNLQQDIEELNEKIVSDKGTITALEHNIKKIMGANEVLEGDINYMKDEMGNLSSELKVLQELLKISATCPSLEENNLNLVKSLTILQEHSEALVDQLKLSQKQVSREIKINDMNFGKITELQNTLDKKTDEFRHTTHKLEQSLKLNKEYENRIIELEQEISEHKKLQYLNEQKAEMVLTCNSDLVCLKQKIDILNKVLNEKSTEILHLHADLSIKADTITNLVKENDVLLKDNKKLTQHAMNIEEQLKNYKHHCHDLNEKFIKCKNELDSLKQWQETVHQKYLQEKNSLVDKVDILQKQESKLSTKLKESTEEIEKMKEAIKEKENAMKNLNGVHEEVVSLKEEIERLSKIRLRVLADNKKLQDQISSIKVNASQFENHKMIVAEQLEKCLDEINMLQCAKEKLEEKNVQLETEVEHLQTAFSDLNHEIRYKNESFINLEHELSETKCNRDEICAESKIVVHNVRSWLEEQKRINESLNDVIREKNLVIDEISMERSMLMKNIKDVCDRYEAVSEELQMCRQYVAEINDRHPQLKLPAQIKRSIYAWGSQNSEGDSHASSPIFIEDRMYDDPYEDNDADPNPAKWMRKVQNMSEDILRSKKYWQTKMAKSAKKIKPVKETNKSKSLPVAKST